MLVDQVVNEKQEKRRESRNIELTQEILKELFDYRDDGFLIRRTNEGQRGRIGDVAGSLNGRGYLQVRIDGRAYYVHRLVWLWHHGYFPENLIDHKDRIKIHNWIDNLREVGQVCNSRNTGVRKDNSSGVKGVSWYKPTGKWMSHIRINQKWINLGYHNDFIEAVAHRLAAEQAENWQGCDSSSPAFLYIQNFKKGE